MRYARSSGEDRVLSCAYPCDLRCVYKLLVTYFGYIECATSLVATGSASEARHCHAHYTASSWQSLVLHCCSNGVASGIELASGMYLCDSPHYGEPATSPTPRFCLLAQNHNVRPLMATRIRLSNICTTLFSSISLTASKPPRSGP